jgi:hypothetical protein
MTNESVVNDKIGTGVFFFIQAKPTLAFTFVPLPYKAFPFGWGFLLSDH